MPTTDQELITQFVERAGELLELPQIMKDESDARLTALSNRYTSLIDTSYQFVFLDTVNGSDDNPGNNVDQPFKTINFALSRMDRGSRVWINVLSDLHIDEEIELNAIALRIHGSKSDGTRVRVTFDRERRVRTNNTDQRNLVGFTLHSGSHLELNGCIIIMPALGQDFDDTVVGDRGMFNSDLEKALMDLVIANSSMELPNTPFMPILGPNVRIAFMVVLNLLQIGDVTNPRGYWLNGVTSSSGTDVNTIPYLLSNLTHV